jgi:hypothetical protein
MPGLVMLPMERGLGDLARAVNWAGWRVLVFNPLPWKRDGQVWFQESQIGDTALHPAAVRPAEGGEAVAISSTRGLGPSGFTARDVPPLGYRVYVPAELPQAAPQLTCDRAKAIVETRFFRAVFDTNRSVPRSLIDKRSGRELVNTQARHGFGQFVYERFSSNEVASFVKAYVKIDADWATNELGKPMLPPSDTNPPEVQPSGRLQIIEATPGRVECFSGANPPDPGKVGEVAKRFTFYADEPYFDILLAVVKPADPWPEAGWLALPFKLDRPRFQLGRLGSLIDPSKDIVPGSNRHLFALNSGLTLTGPDGFGVGLCSPDMPLVSLGEPGCWKYSVEDFPRSATVYVNLFNNQWTTNFRLWNEGLVTANARIWSVEKGEDAEAALITPSLETRFPLQAVIANGSAGSLPPTGTGLELSRRGIQVTAFGANPDDDGLVLRLWELAGESGDCQVTLPAGLKVMQVQPVNLRGRPAGAAISVKDGRFTTPLKAFAPASFVLAP